MRSRRSFLVRAVATLAVLATTATVAAPPVYRIVDLGAPPDTWGIDPWNLNSQGQVVGSYLVGATQSPFVWSADSGFLSLGAVLPAGSSAAADAINDQGQVVLSSFGPNGWIGYVWSAGAPLLTLPYLNGSATGRNAPWSINNAGVVVGAASGSDFVDRVYRWSATDGIAPLGPLASVNDFIGAHTINDAGVAAGGRVVAAGVTQAFKWTPGSGATDLPAVSGLTGNSEAWDINLAGWAVGSIGNTAVLWRDAHGLALGHLPGDITSVAMGVNTRGEVVGRSFVGSTAHAFLWTEGDGLMDLQLLIAPDDPLLPSTLLQRAQAINDNGQIAATAIIGGQPRAVLLTPVPEPTTGWLWLAGIALVHGAVSLRRARRIG